jgi:hypothetical protein
VKINKIDREVWPYSMDLNAAEASKQRDEAAKKQSRRLIALLAQQPLPSN